MSKKIDPELIRQLEPTSKAVATNNANEEELIEAIIKIEGDSGQEEVTFESLLETLLERLEKSEHLRPDDYNVFPLMKRAVVRAKKTYIKKLIEQSEVVAAMANQRQK